LKHGPKSHGLRSPAAAKANFKKKKRILEEHLDSSLASLL
jgi:hypothetical protein